MSDTVHGSTAEHAADGRAPLRPTGDDGEDLGVAEVRPSNAADRAEQGLLYDRCFGKDDGQAVVPWRYDESPHGVAVAPIARDAAGALVSSYACQPRRVLYRATDGARAEGVVGQTGDVMTDPELRSRGIFSHLHWRAMDEARARGWVAAWGLPNQFSGRIFFNKLGWHHAGHIGPWNLVLCDDRRARALRAHNGRRREWTTPWAVWRGRAHRARLRRSRAGLAVEPLARFPREVDELTAAAAERAVWMTRRTKEALDWRFLEAPSRRFEAVGVRDGTGTLVAYAVVQRPDPETGLAAIPDLVGIDAAAQDAALEGALDRLEALGAAVVRAYGMRGSPWEAILARGGFRRPAGYKEVGAFPLVDDHPLARATLDTSLWYFTDGDRDDEYVR